MQDRENFHTPVHQLRPRHTPVSLSERIRIAQAAGTQNRTVPVSLSVPPWQEDDKWARTVLPLSCSNVPRRMTASMTFPRRLGLRGR